MSILATGKKLITLGEAYSAGAGIDITDHVISVTSEGTPYSAGPNIDIQGHVISGKDWTDDIANASANAFSESYNASTAYTDQEIFDTTNNITSVISSVSSTLNTQINEVSASVSSVTDDIVGEINDLSASIDYVSGTLETVSGDITAMIPTDYYTTANPSGFITNVSAETTYQPIGNYASASDITGFATKTELENTSGAITSMIPSTAGLATESDLQIVSAGVDYVSGALTGYQPIGDYATTGQLNTASGILSGAIDYISGVAVTSTAGLATTGQLDTASSFLSGTIDGLSGDIAYVSANAGKTYSGVSPIVVNNNELKISASTFQLSAGDNITFTEEGNIVRIDGQAGGGSYTGDAQGALDEVYTNSSHWNESYTALTANSGTWTGGNPEVEQVVQTYSAAGTWLTAHQSLAGYATTGELDTVSSILSAAIDYVSANAGTTGEYIPIENSGISAYGKIYGTNELELGSATPPTVKTFEGYDWGDDPYKSWNYDVYVDGWLSGTTEDTLVNWPVDVLQGIDAETFHIDFTDANGYEKTFNIPSASVPYLSSVSFNGLSSIPDVTVTGYHESELNYAELVYYGSTYLGVTTTGDTPTATVSVSAGSESNILYVKDGVASAVDFVTNNGISLSSITAIGTSLTGDAQGAVDEVYSNSAHWNDNYSTVTTNSASWGGTPLPMSAGDGIDIQIENDTLVISATGGAGNPEVENYVQTNSASIDDVVSTYETNSASYLTAHQDISNKLDTTAFSDVSGSFLTAINIPESASWNDATTAYQTNSASYMTESNLEYNAVNEISGYAGSAIAQYGAEKQWLVHDDTLVHAANSAQYALGVNLSAIAQLLGIDETVLYSGNTPTLNNTFNITEPFSAFKKIAFRCKSGENANTTYYDTDVLQSKIAFKGEWAYNWMNKVYFKCDMVTPTSYSYTANTVEILKHTGTAVSAALQVIQNDATNSTGVWTIIGIGRKQ